MARSTRSTRATAKLSACTVKLPSDILLRIFHLLPQTTLFTTAQVCKEWHTLTLSQELWTHIDQEVLERWYALKRNRSINDFYTFLQHERFERLEHLSFPKQLKFGEYPLLGLLPNGEFTTDTLSEKIVATQRGVVYESHNTEVQVQRLLRACKYIETLNVCNGQFGQGDLRNYVDIANLNRIVAPLFASFSDSISQLVTTFGPQLVDIRFIYAIGKDRSEGFDVLRNIALSCPNLKVLCVASKNIRKVYRNHPHKGFRLANTVQVTNECLSQVIERCTLLRRLAIVNISMAGVLFDDIYRKRLRNELLQLERLECGLYETHFMEESTYQGLSDLNLLQVHSEYATVDNSVFFGREIGN